MGCKIIFVLVLIIFFGGLASAECNLSSAHWPSSAVVGETVELVVVSENYDRECEGKTITFKIYEDDDPGGDDYVTAPASIYGYSYPPLVGGVPISPNYKTTWQVVWREDTESGESNPPEYYFIATVSGTTESIQSGLLEAIPAPFCGDGICNNAETCSNCSADCGACVVNPFCGDGNCNNAETCSNCSVDCGACVVNPFCGDGTCNNAETCSNCSVDCGCSSGKHCQAGICIDNEIFSYSSFDFSQKGSIIGKLYLTADYLNAKINISFHNESIYSILEDSLGNSIELIDLLEDNSNYDYDFNNSAETTLDSKFQILDLDLANFSMPEAIGSFDYQLNFSGIELFQEEFEIIMDNSIKSKIDKKYKLLNESKKEIEKYPLDMRKILNDFLNIKNIEEELISLGKEYSNSNGTEKYNQILENLSYLEIPEEMEEITSADGITFYPKKENINLDFLEDTFGGDYENNAQGYINAIQFWNLESLDTKINFKEILVKYDSGDEISLGLFEFEFDAKNLKEDAYFIIENQNVIFGDEYSPTEEEGYLYFNIREIPSKISFYSDELIDLTNLPAFISPALSDLNSTDLEYTEGDEDAKTSKWILFGLIIFLLILVAIITYIMIQIWYKKKYENYLFKTRNNLYNIMTYIQTSKKKGLERSNIIRNLKKSGWNGEQINYALRKYEGKKILGIIENPFKRFVERIEQKPTNYHTKV